MGDDYYRHFTSPLDPFSYLEFLMYSSHNLRSTNGERLAKTFKSLTNRKGF